jgi:hypothetical protein
MPILLLLLAFGVLGFLWYQRATTTLTRDCRWWQDKGNDLWHCTFCGAQSLGDVEPKDCLRG